MDATIQQGLPPEGSCLRQGRVASRLCGEQDASGGWRHGERATANGQRRPAHRKRTGAVDMSGGDGHFCPICPDGMRRPAMSFVNAWPAFIGGLYGPARPGADIRRGRRQEHRHAMAHAASALALPKAAGRSPPWRGFSRSSSPRRLPPRTASSSRTTASTASPSGGAVPPRGAHRAARRGDREVADRAHRPRQAGQSAEHARRPRRELHQRRPRSREPRLARRRRHPPRLRPVGRPDAGRRSIAGPRRSPRDFHPTPTISRRPLRQSRRGPTPMRRG